MKTCGCGHAEDLHLVNARDPKAKRGPCQYGEHVGTTVRRCPCLGMHSRGSKGVFADEDAPLAPRTSREATVLDALATFAKAVETAAATLHGTLRNASTTELLRDVVHRDTKPEDMMLPTPPPRRARTERSSAAAARSQGPPSGALRKMLIVLAQAKSPTLTTKQMAIRAGIAVGSGNTNSLLAVARANGWIEGPARATSITPSGREALGSFEQLPSGAALLEHYLGKWGRSSSLSRLLSFAAAAHPRAVSNEELAQGAGLTPASGNTNTLLAKLRSLDLLEQPGPGMNRASEELFDA